MISIHGWAEIIESYREVDYSVEALSRAIGLIEEKVYSIIGRPEEKYNEPIKPWETENCRQCNRKDNTVIDLSQLNGSYHLSVMADWNHKTGRWDSVYELFELIANVAIGSYGFLYVRDDEDNDGYQNEMQIYVLKKGTFLREKDVYLSPCIPEIEEA